MIMMKQRSIVILFFVVVLHTLLDFSFSFLFTSTTRKRFSPNHQILNSKKCFDIHQTKALKSTLDLSTRLYGTNEENTEEQVKVGSKDYYSGFLSRGIKEDSEDRVTGDAVLLPTLKFVGGFSVIIGALLLVFLASNGLLL